MVAVVAAATAAVVSRAGVTAVDDVGVVVPMGMGLLLLLVVLLLGGGGSGVSVLHVLLLNEGVLGRLTVLVVA